VPRVSQDQLSFGGRLRSTWSGAASRSCLCTAKAPRERSPHTTLSFLSTIRSRIVTSRTHSISPTTLLPSKSTGFPFYFHSSPVSPFSSAAPWARAGPSSTHNFAKTQHKAPSKTLELSRPCSYVLTGTDKGMAETFGRSRATLPPSSTTRTPTSFIASTASPI
jgi:hypothetical protein